MRNNDRISRAALLAAYDAAHKGPPGNARKLIAEAPAIDAAPVVHGRWLVDENPHDGDVRCSRCSACIDALHERHWPTLNALGYTFATFYRYCPQCGARMDRGEHIDTPTCGPDYCEIGGGDE